jgi:uncharacterized protein
LAGNKIYCQPNVKKALLLSIKVAIIVKQLIGRKPEIKALKESLASDSAELVALYGRRRVGKTYLVRTVFEQELILELTGLNEASFAEQIENFSLTISRTLQLPLRSIKPDSWLQAFHLLMDALEPHLQQEKKVLFLDELPWFDTHKSGFLSAFDHFWNTWASKQDNLVVVICGSAASWMIQNIVRNKGGLHNRITRRIRLAPFTLSESAEFLKAKHVDLTPYQVLQIYMVMGGIPHYLNNIRRGESVDQTIDRMCFTNDGFLSDEFDSLYKALFGVSGKHEKIIEVLSGKKGGLSRNEIMDACQITSGGTLTTLLEELTESGFMTEYIPYQRIGKESIFKLSDEFSLFYLRFMRGQSFGTGSWQSKSSGNDWKIWCGLAFESICLKHVPQIKKALGIGAVYSEQSAWRYVPKEADEQGAQVDLLIDRQDNCINLCEIKFSGTLYELDKQTAAQLLQKKQVFQLRSKTNKSVFVTIISTFGVKENSAYLSVGHNQITMESLFEAS